MLPFLFASCSANISKLSQVSRVETDRKGFGFRLVLYSSTISKPSVAGTWEMGSKGMVVHESLPRVQFVCASARTLLPSSLSLEASSCFFGPAEVFVERVEGMPNKNRNLHISVLIVPRRLVMYVCACRPATFIRVVGPADLLICSCAASGFLDVEGPRAPANAGLVPVDVGSDGDCFLAVAVVVFVMGARRLRCHVHDGPVVQGGGIHAIVGSLPVAWVVVVYGGGGPEGKGGQKDDGDDAGLGEEHARLC